MALAQAGAFGAGDFQADYPALCRFKRFDQLKSEDI
jgi:hypothetical protein